MRRRVGAGFALAVVIVGAFIVWRSYRRTDHHAASGTSATAAEPWKASGSRARSRKLDAKTPATASLAGAITDAATRAPIAGAEVCADGWSTELASELLREPFCASSDAQGRYLLANLLPATYFIHATARTYRPELHHPAGEVSQRFIVLATDE